MFARCERRGRRNPDSFFDLEKYLHQIFDEPKPSLIDMIRRMVWETPQCLGVLGIAEFEEKSEESEEEEAWDY